MSYIPHSNKIDHDWGAESLFVAGCEPKSDLVCPFVEPVREWNLFFVVFGQKSDLDTVSQSRPRCQFELNGIP